MRTILILVNLFLWTNLLNSCIGSNYEVLNKQLLEEPVLDIDILHIDTGNSSEYNDLVLFYPKTDFQTNVHGTQMVKSFYDQLVKEKLTGVKGRQAAFGYESLWTGYHYIKSLKFAATIKTKVVSLSGGGEKPDDYEQELIQKLCDCGVIFLAASGNEDNKIKHYPASYKLDCLISVGTSKNGKRIDYSNEADVYLEEDYFEAGTSYSTARFGAIVLRYLRDYPRLSIKEIKQLLLQKYGLENGN